MGIGLANDRSLIPIAAGLIKNQTPGRSRPNDALPAGSDPRTHPAMAAIKPISPVRVPDRPRRAGRARLGRPREPWSACGLLRTGPLRSQRRRALVQADLPGCRPGRGQQPQRAPNPANKPGPTLRPGGCEPAGRAAHRRTCRSGHHRALCRAKPGGPAATDCFDLRIRHRSLRAKNNRPIRENQRPTLRGSIDGELTWPIFAPGAQYHAVFPERSRPKVTEDVHSLEPYGFPPAILDAWAGAIPSLNQLQIDAVNEFRILEGETTGSHCATQASLPSARVRWA